MVLARKNDIKVGLVLKIETHDYNYTILSHLVQEKSRRRPCAKARGNRGLAVEVTLHCPNPLYILIGASSKARNGNSWQHILRLLRLANDPRCRHLTSPRLRGKAGGRRSARSSCAASCRRALGTLRSRFQRTPAGSLPGANP